MPASRRHEAMVTALALLEDRIDELEKDRNSLAEKYRDIRKDEKSPLALREGLARSILKTTALIARCERSRDWFYDNIFENFFDNFEVFDAPKEN